MQNKKVIIATSALLVLLLAVGGYYFSQRNDQVDTDTTDGINYNPPTEEEQKSGDAQKEKIIDREKKISNAQDNNTATVIITDAGQYDDVIEVRSFISDHYEDGTCTIKFQKGNSVITKDTPAYRDASTTICTNPLFKRSEFPSAGDWQVKVSYKSAGASGESKSKTVGIN